MRGGSPLPGNARRSGSRAAGYAPKQVGSNIYRVLRRPRVAAAIAVAMAEREQDLRIDGRAVIREIALLGFANLLDYIRPNEDGTADVDLSGLTRDQAAGIAEMRFAEARGACPACGERVRGGISFRLKLVNKSRNLELLARHLGLFRPGAAERLKTGAGDGAAAAEGDAVEGGESLAGAEDEYAHLSSMEFFRRFMDAAQRECAAREG